MEVITNVSVVHSIFVAAIREKKNKSRERYGWEQSHSIRENNAKSSAKRSDREYIREEGATRRNWGRNNIHHDAGSLVGSWWFIRTIARKKWRTNKKRKSQNKTEKKKKFNSANVEDIFRQLERNIHNNKRDAIVKTPVHFLKIV